MRSQGELDGQVLLRGHKPRSRDPPLGHGGQGGLERPVLFLMNDHPVESQPSGDAFEAVPHTSGGVLWSRKVAARGTGAVPGDQRRGNVLADVLATRAVAVPVPVLREQRNLGTDHSATSGDAKHDRVTLRAFSDDGIHARQLDASRPGLGKAGGAHGLEQRLQSLCHRDSPGTHRVWLAQGPLATPETIACAADGGYEDGKPFQDAATVSSSAASSIRRRASISRYIESCSMVFRRVRDRCSMMNSPVFQRIIS